MADMAQPEFLDAADRALVDRDLIDRYRTMAGDEFVRLLINQYLEEAADLVEAILMAINDDRSSDVASAAHKLKGSSATIGAIEMAAICSEIEAHSRAGDREDAALLSEGLKGQYQSARRELHRLSAAPAEFD